MKRSARMEKIADITLDMENLASASLATIMAQYQFHENQLKQLELYREEYHERLNSRMRDSISLTEIRDYQYFFASLDEAIEQQKQNVARIARHVETSRSAWLEKKRDTEKLSRVVSNLKQMEGAVERKREQKETDELNIARHFSRKSLMHPA